MTYRCNMLLLHKRFVSANIDAVLQSYIGPVPSNHECKLTSDVSVDFHIVEASSRKLLLEAEEAIETQLDYAERRINSIHHVSILHSQFVLECDTLIF